jgi:hypothetical protein
VNVGFRDERIAARLMEDYVADLLCSREVTADEWKHRAVLEKLIGTGAWTLERQQ